MTREHTKAVAKAAYNTPALKVFGSVRDLTGNNSGGLGDMSFPADAMGT